jgi:hypothetical protein
VKTHETERFSIFCVCHSGDNDIEIRSRVERHINLVLVVTFL